MIDGIADKLVSEPPFPPGIPRQATVTAISLATGTCTITIGGGATAIAGVHYLAWYVPRVNDVVWVIQHGAHLLILGPVAGTGQGAGDFDQKKRTSGNLTLNSTVWANLDNNLDIVLGAVAGDWIEVGVSGYFGSEAVYACLDVVSVVGGNPVNHFSGSGGSNGQGVSAWKSNNASEVPIGGTILYQLVAGDISNSTVTIRMRYRTLSAANKTLQGAADFALVFHARNLGGQR